MDKGQDASASVAEVRDPHKLFMSDGKLVDGGVVVMRYRPFCRCGWVGKPTEKEPHAVAAYEAHVESVEA